MTAAAPLRLRADAMEWRLVEGEIVVLNLDTSMYLSINRTGAEVWPLLVEGSDEDALVARITQAFDVDSDTARRDLEAFLSGLRDQGLLESA